MVSLNVSLTAIPFFLAVVKAAADAKDSDRGSVPAGTPHPMKWTLAFAASVVCTGSVRAGDVNFSSDGSGKLHPDFTVDAGHVARLPHWSLDCGVFVVLVDGTILASRPGGS